MTYNFFATAVLPGVVTFGTVMIILSVAYAGVQKIIRHRRQQILLAAKLRADEARYWNRNAR